MFKWEWVSNIYSNIKREVGRKIVVVVGYERYDKKGRDYTMMKANGWSLSEYFTVIITLYKYTHIEKKKNKEKREQMVIFVAWAERKKKTYV